MPVSTTIKIRRGTRAEWDLADPILEVSEIAHVTDENAFRIGDGAALFSVLPYFGQALLDVLGDTALKVGDFTGDALGLKAIDIQSARSNVSQVASASDTIAVGHDIKITGTKSIGIGRLSTIVGSGTILIGDQQSADSEADCVFVGTNLTAGVGSKRSVLIGANSTIAGIGAGLDSENVVVGYAASADGRGAIAIGKSASSQGQYSISVGHTASCITTESIAIGRNALASGIKSCAVGLTSKANGARSSAFGHNAYTSIDDVAEVGTWVGAARGASIRAHGNTGMVATTAQDRDAAYTASIATKGEEPDNQLALGMFALRFSNVAGDKIILDYNDAGTIKSFEMALT